MNLYFLGGMSKKDFLKSFQADIFFDDQKKHIIDTQEILQHQAMCLMELKTRNL